MNRQACFETPLFVTDVPEAETLNEPLVEWFSEESRARPGVDRSISGGWHSAELSDRIEPLIQTAMGMFHHYFGQALSQLYGSVPVTASLSVGLSAWATVLEAGGYSIVHDHGDAQLSAVYWAAAGDTSDLSGWLELIDPRRSSLKLPELPLLESRVRIRPTTGTLVVFPGYLQHFVHPYRGDNPRVSLAANAVVRAD